VLEGDLFGPVVIDDGADVTIDGATITSGFPPFTLSSPVLLTTSSLRIARSSIEARNLSGGPQSCIDVTTSGSIAVDPTTTLTPANGAASISGPPSATFAEIVTQRARASGSTLDVELQGRTGAAFGTILSFPVPGLPTPFGDLWVDPFGHLVVQTGVLAARQANASIPLPGLPSGFFVVTQSVVLDAELTLSNAAPAVFP
ncbi:MAG: hypothetical protein KDB80_06005, partial [Planctomycetes bacterium]|nr:hypothetical protein [Planctomycetota bacterium]